MSILVFFFLKLKTKVLGQKYNKFHTFQPKIEDFFWAKLEKKTYKKNQVKTQLV